MIITKINIFFTAAIVSCAFFINLPSKAQDKKTLVYGDERHFKNMRQLTTGGDNAEAYFGFNNKDITFQRTNPKEGINCDQIFYGTIPKKADRPFTYKKVSTGKGRTTCAYLMPDHKHFLYASTHLAADTCPPVPDRSVIKKYVWPIYESYDIFVADFDGKITKRLTNIPGYDAEATISPKGDKIVFTSMRNGDLDIYTMNIDGTNVKQISHDLGYDGGPCFSPDSKKIVWRASRPKTDDAIKEYKALLAQGLVMPTQMEVFVANADGSGAVQVTHQGKANWAPSFTPDSRRIVFASNHEYERGFPFNLYLINIDGTGLERISHDSSFDAFPMFSPDGKKFIFSSNRNNNGGHDTNVFVCDWIE
ncbi:MAG: PD40 domain-containing protein [Taibaiella sp.]|nr:PD40 domain-containing protein [Taibaiella sp.]